MRIFFIIFLAVSCDYFSEVKVPAQLTQKDKECSEYRQEVLYFGSFNPDREKNLKVSEEKAIELLNKFDQNHYSTETTMVEMMQELERNCNKPLLDRYTVYSEKLTCSLAFSEINFFQTLFDQAEMNKWSKTTIDLLESKALSYVKSLLQRPSSGIGLTSAFNMLEGVSDLGRKVPEIDKIKTLRKSFDQEMISLRLKNPRIDFSSCPGVNVIFEEVRLVRKFRNELLSLRSP
jgi:hypothetical protein